MRLSSGNAPGALECGSLLPHRLRELARGFRAPGEGSALRALQAGLQRAAACCRTPGSSGGLWCFGRFNLRRRRLASHLRRRLLLLRLQQGAEQDFERVQQARVARFDQVVRHA